MTITLSDREEALVKRMLASGRYRDGNELIRAGLRKIAEEDNVQNTDVEQFPVGSMLYLFTEDRNAEEGALVKGSSLLLEDE
jgi:Arc/MetJ-type ribon-helix-helix transcriptional regulator